MFRKKSKYSAVYYVSLLQSETMGRPGGIRWGMLHLWNRALHSSWRLTLVTKGWGLFWQGEGQPSEGNMANWNTMKLELLGLNWADTENSFFLSGTPVSWVLRLVPFQMHEYISYSIQPQETNGSLPTFTGQREPWFIMVCTFHWYMATERLYNIILRNSALHNSLECFYHCLLSLLMEFWQ